MIGVLQREYMIDVRWEPRHDDVPPHSTTTFCQCGKAWSRPFVSVSTSTTRWAMTTALISDRCCSTCLPTPTLHRRSASLDDIFEEMNYRREGRVGSLRTRFWKLSGEKEDKGYKRNT